MNKTLFILTALAVGTVTPAAALECVVTADRMAADNLTGTLVATGNVSVVSAPFRMLSSNVKRTLDDGCQTFSFGDKALVTTCTNDVDHLHWCATGTVVYHDRSGCREKGLDAYDEFVGEDLTLRLFGLPLAWTPYAWLPRNTDYGWRVMPGYTSRWGAYVLTKYVYPIAGEMGEGKWGLDGSTRFDLRTKNGVAVGQSLGWSLGDFGRGKFKIYYANDRDADRYDRNWNSLNKWHYANWGSEVPDNRYCASLEHLWLPTERDTVRAAVAYYSDSHFHHDFLRSNHLSLANRFPRSDVNELAWEHLEQTFAVGASVTGQVNDFYGGIARLPEVYLDLAPQPLFGLPVNYESQSRFGWLNRSYGKHGTYRTSIPFRYDPGAWADYQAARGDTYHRLTLPFKVADVVSVVPRVGLRGTWWSDSGTTMPDGTHRTHSLDKDVTRAIVEGGVTFAARGTAPIADRWQHLVEPYADVLVQKADYSGLKKGMRPYIFDSIDASSDWLDQFAGRSRNLPYSWQGVTPGLRNAFRKADENGTLRTVFDVDFYAAVQFNDTEWTEGNRYHRLTRDPADPNYGKDGDCTVMPGVRARWYATSDAALMTRLEWDGENDKLAYADVSWRHRLSKAFNYTVSYSARDQRLWDYSSTPYDPTILRNEDFNWSKFGYLELTCEHEICDAFGWGPFIRWDTRENELDEIGSWFEYRTDCIGFRLTLSYENDYRRIDNSVKDSNWRCGFGIYLRALGRSAGTMF